MAIPPSQSAPEPRPARFVWPPRPLPREVARTAARIAGAGAPGYATDLGEPVSVFEAFERAFLGLKRPNWARRAQAAGFFPDAPHAYCPSCGASAGPHGVVVTERGARCAACPDGNPPWLRVVRLGSYAGVLREGVLDLKYTAWRALGHEMGRDLGRTLRTALVDARVDPARCLVMPVPTSTLRRLRRGIDHPLVIARGMASVLGCPVQKFLSRKHRPQQTSQSLDARRRNVAKTMRASGPVEAVLARDEPLIILVDDVMTSGATMREACRALFHSPSPGQARLADRSELRIWAAVLGVTPRG